MNQALSDELFTTSARFSGYRKIREALDEGGSHNVRVTYSRGRLELMAPSHRHERRKSTLRMFLEALLVEWEIDFEPAGSTTIDREDLDQGFEADEGYWLAHALAPEAEYDAQRDPPPDLLVEIEVSRSVINRLSLFANLGVPEVWRYTRERQLEVLVLTESGYEQRDHSPTIPGLDLGELQRHLTLSEQTRVPAALRLWRDWLRAHHSNTSIYPPPREHSP